MSRQFLRWWLIFRRCCASLDAIVKIALAAVFFSLFMEAFHMPVGPSELHFVGASAVYFVFGFLPALFGFAIGLSCRDSSSSRKTSCISA